MSLLDTIQPFAPTARHATLTASEPALVQSPRIAITPPQKSRTDDRDQRKPKITKRIVVCCDGTWQDGLILKDRWKFTNVLRLARAINHSDERFNPPIPQVVFYQAGVGTDVGQESRVIDGATGASLAEKVQEAYAFIAHNWELGDEVLIFGFSRGAYTARMVADLIGHIGIMDRKHMDDFATMFISFQKRGKAKDPSERAHLDEKLKRWTSPDADGRRRVKDCENGFVVKCVGVFDTVGALGLPNELTFFDKMRTLFGFNDRLLGVHIERAYHAMAINEKRSDFVSSPLPE